MTAVQKEFNLNHANNYDQKASKSKWLDPAIVFGMSYRFIQPGESLLDVGIGTGLSSELFYKAGLKIHGIDFSPEMLACCRAKQMACRLLEHDLSVTPYPFGDSTMDHAVCTGVTHLFEDITPIFKELQRILKPGGIFAFVVRDCREDESRTGQIVPAHATDKKITFFAYSKGHIDNLLNSHGFNPVHELNFTASAIGRKTAQYKAYVVTKA